jgi:hypothetical protein
MKRGSPKDIGTSMRTTTIKIVFVAALGCAAAVIEARSSEKLSPEVCLWTALGVVVLFFNKNGRNASEAHEDQVEEQDCPSVSHHPARRAPDRSGDVTVEAAACGRMACVSSWSRGGSDGVAREVQPLSIS